MSRLGRVEETHDRWILLQDEGPGRGESHATGSLIVDLVNDPDGDGGESLDSVELLTGEMAIVICVAIADASRLAEAILPLLGELPDGGSAS